MLIGYTILHVHIAWVYCLLIIVCVLKGVSQSTKSTCYWSKTYCTTSTEYPHSRGTFKNGRRQCQFNVHVLWILYMYINTCMYMYDMYMWIYTGNTCSLDQENNRRRRTNCSPIGSYSVSTCICIYSVRVKEITFRSYINMYMCTVFSHALAFSKKQLKQV